MVRPGQAASPARTAAAERGRATRRSSDLVGDGVGAGHGVAGGEGGGLGGAVAVGDGEAGAGGQPRADRGRGARKGYTPLFRSGRGRCRGWSWGGWWRRWWSRWGRSRR